MEFILIAYYTTGSVYEESAMALLESAKKLNVQTHFLGISDRGGWGKNTEYKPYFVRDAMLALLHVCLFHQRMSSAHDRRYLGHHGCLTRSLPPNIHDGIRDGDHDDALLGGLVDGVDE